MTLSTTAIIYRKELTELLRDRRTLMFMVLFPVIVFPLLISVVNRFMNDRSTTAAAEARFIAVHSSTKPPELIAALQKAGFETIAKQDLSKAVKDKEAAAAVDDAASPSGVRSISIYTDETRQASQLAGERLKSALDSLKLDVIRARVVAAGLPPETLSPFDVKTVNVAEDKKMAGFLVGAALGYMLVIFMFSAVLPAAVDATAGEKERHTLEVLLCSGGSRSGIILGKILATATVSFFTGCITLASMSYSLKNLSGNGSSPLSQVNIFEPSTIALVLLTVLPIALFASSCMIAIALFAKSYKEGQTYATPFLLLAIFPAMIGMLPGLELTPALALIPVFNVSQLVKEIFLGSFNMTSLWIAFAVNVCYASLAFWLATSLFRRESVLFRT